MNYKDPNLESENGPDNIESPDNDNEPKKIDILNLVDQIKKSEDLNFIIKSIHDINFNLRSSNDFLHKKDLDYTGFCYNIISVLLENGDTSQWVEVLNSITNWSYKNGLCSDPPPHLVNHFFQLCLEELNQLVQLHSYELPFQLDTETCEIPTAEEQDRLISTDGEIHIVGPVLQWACNSLIDCEYLLQPFIEYQIYRYFPFLIRHYHHINSLFSPCVSIMNIMLESGYTQFDLYHDFLLALQEVQKLTDINVLKFIYYCTSNGNDFCFFYNNVNFFCTISSTKTSKEFKYASYIIKNILSKHFENSMQVVIDSKIIYTFILNLISLRILKIIENEQKDGNKPKEKTKPKKTLLAGGKETIAFYKLMSKYLITDDMPYEEIVFAFKEDFMDILNYDMCNASFHVKIAALKFACTLSHYLHPEDLVFCISTETFLNIMQYFDCEDKKMLYVTAQLLLEIVDSCIKIPPTLPRPKHQIFPRTIKTKKKSKKVPILNIYTIASHLDSPEFDEAISADVDDAPEDYINLTNELHDRVQELIDLSGNAMNSLDSEGLIDLDIKSVRELDEEYYNY